MIHLGPKNTPMILSRCISFLPPAPLREKQNIDWAILSSLSGSSRENRQSQITFAYKRNSSRRAHLVPDLLWARDSAWVTEKIITYPSYFCVRVEPDSL